jgi:ADP-ribose pyrophosphatase YjhB (NUDIX family)
MNARKAKPASTLLRPQLGVSACIFKNGKVLLAERTKPPFDGVWSLPGGHVEHGERLAAAAHRELLEETGIEADFAKPFDWAEIILTSAGGEIETHYVIAVFAGIWRAGEARAGSDARAVEWVSIADIAKHALTPETGRIIQSAAQFLRIQ